MNLSANFSEVVHLGKRMAAFPANFTRAMALYQEESTEKLLALVRQKASGRPGPNVVTGRYLANFMIAEGRVVNLSRQTHRLEYGFVGADSLGRVYHQPPFPHFRPALEEMREQYKRGMVPLVRQAWNQS